MQTPVRLFRHPGPVAPERMMHALDARAHCFRLEIRSGVSLLEAIAEPLWRLGFHSATLRLFGGAFAQISYTLPRHIPPSDHVVDLQKPARFGRDVPLVLGSGTLGRGIAGEPTLHCHALFIEDGQPRGGHLFPQDTIVGIDRPVAMIHAFERVGIGLRHDPEVGVAIFHPEPAEGAHA